MRRRRSLGARGRTWLLAVFAPASWLATVPGVALGAPVDAEDAQRVASRAFDAGRAAFARRDFVEAARAFERAGELVPHPSALLNAAESWELANDPVRAAEVCERVLSLPALDAKYHGEVSARLERLAQRTAIVEVRAPTGAEVRIDGGEPTTIPARTRVLPGRHAISLGGSSPMATTEVELRAGESRALDLTPSPRSPPSIARVRLAPPEPRRAIPTATWIFFGAAGASTVVATVFGIATLSAKDDFDALPTRQNADDFSRNKLVTNVAIGAAVTATVIGAGIWIFSRRPPEVTARRGEPWAALAF